MHPNEIFARERGGQMDCFDVVDGVERRRPRNRLAFVELVAVINLAVRRHHLEVEIVDQRRNRRGQPGDIGVNQRNLERFFGTPDDDPPLISLAGA